MIRTGLACSKRVMVGFIASLLFCLVPALTAEAEEAADDLCRPAYHLTPPTGRMGDPNGLCRYDGKHHLFYLHYWKWPQDAQPSSWAHVVSEDMVRWQEAPTAFFPGDPYDSRACWSGCLRIIEGVPTIFYSGRGNSGVSLCRATSKDMFKWTKTDDNPLMTPEQLRGNWDHCIWCEGDTYLMLTGGRQGADLFESKDSRSWTYLHPLLAEDPKRSLDKWDCPHLFELGGKHVLIVYAHPMRQNIYFVGRYENRRLHVETQGNLDIGVNAGGTFSAAHPTYRDPRGRQIIVGMMQERERYKTLGIRRTWTNAISLPRVLTVGDDKRLRFDPVDEVKSLRGRHWQFADIGLAAGRRHRLPGVLGECLEIEIEIDPGKADRCSLAVRCGRDGKEETPIVYDAQKNGISLKGVSDSLVLADGETLKLRVFVDRSLVEVYANRRVCLSAWTYPRQNDCVHVDLSAVGGAARVKSVDAWQMQGKPDKTSTERAAAQSPFDDAAAFWQMRDLQASAKTAGGLLPEGQVEVGVTMLPGSAADT